MAATASQDIEIDVSGLGGHLCHISANEDWSVSQLKQAIHEATGIFKNLQQLFVDDAELRDAQLLSALLGGTSMATQASSVEITLIKRPPEYHEWLQKMKRAPNAADVLKNAPEHIRSDRSIVMAAVKCDGRALQFACEEFQADPDIVMSAGESNASSFAFAAPELRNSYQFVLMMVERNGCALVNASTELQANPLVVTAAVIENEYALRYAAKHLQEDPQFLLRLVQKNPDVLSVMPYKLKKQLFDKRRSCSKSSATR